MCIGQLIILHHKIDFQMRRSNANQD
jgi:hypothetical protein